MRSFNFIKPMSILALTATLSLAACGPDGGPDATAADGAAPTADAGVGAATPAAQFIGAWTYESGAAVISCSDGSTEELQAGGGTVTFTPGANGNRVVSVSDTNCAVACMISGATATCETGSCDAGDGAIATVQSDVFTLSGGELHETSTVQFAANDGSTCTMALEDAVLKKSTE